MNSAPLNAAGINEAYERIVSALFADAMSIGSAASIKPRFTLRDTLHAYADLDPRLEVYMTTADTAAVAAMPVFGTFGLLTDACDLTSGIVPTYTKLCLLADALAVAGRITPTLELTLPLRARLAVRLAPRFVAYALAADGLALVDAASLDYTRLLLAADALSVVDTTRVTTETTLNMTELFAVAADLWYIAQCIGTDAVGFYSLSTLDVTRALRAAETIRLVDRHAPALLLQLVLVDALGTADGADFRYLLEHLDSIDLTDAATLASLRVLLARDNLALLDQTTSDFILLYRTADACHLADQVAPTLTASLRFQDGLAFISRLPLGDDDFQAFVLNTDTLGVTQYNQFPFNSFATIHNTTYGCTETGLYELTGSTDDGDPIEAWLKTGDIAWAGMSEANVPRAYLFVGSSDDLYLKTISSRFGERAEHWYRLTTKDGDERTRRVKLGRGVRGTRWAFEVRNIDGGDFDLRGFDVMPVILRRRG